MNDKELQELLEENLDPIERDTESCIASLSESYALTAEEYYNLFW